MIIGGHPAWIRMFLRYVYRIGTRKIDQAPFEPEKSPEKKGPFAMLLLRGAVPVLLVLPLRFRDLPGVHGGEPLGDDLQ